MPKDGNDGRVQRDVLHLEGFNRATSHGWETPRVVMNSNLVEVMCAMTLFMESGIKTCYLHEMSLLSNMEFANCESVVTDK